MPITPPISEPVITYTVNDLLNDSLIEVGIASPSDPADNESLQWAFRKANYVLDRLSASKNFVHASTFAQYTLVPGLLPHTIGPGLGATYSVPQRPVKVVRASVVLNQTVQPFVEDDLEIRDDQWWMQNSIKGLASAQPTDLFYNPAFPNGELYVWPVPTVALGLKLQLWGLLAQFGAITDPLGGPGSSVFAMPPGYRNMLMLTIAEELLPGADKPVNQALVANAARARSAVFGNNNKVPRMSTRDSGVPGADQDLRSTTFNYRSRSF